jgi:ubiquinone/menaquinone biosynthesis C-methylase UbiE
MSPAATHMANDFSRQYYLLRNAEGRIYTDDEVALLPVINGQHRHYREWVARRASTDRLVKYLSDRNKELQILEVGCGNGWLAARLAGIPRTKVTGIDINIEELEQAKRVFNKTGNLEFYSCSLDDELINELHYDIIVFASSIQYFSSLNDVLRKAMSMLKAGGEIHVIDSNFYLQNEVEAARQRTNKYYQSIGFPEMTGQYFHHSMQELAPFDPEILYDPHSLLNRVKKNKNPFYWIKINA